MSHVMETVGPGSRANRPVSSAFVASTFLIASTAYSVIIKTLISYAASVWLRQLMYPRLQTSLENRALVVSSPATTVPRGLAISTVPSYCAIAVTKDILERIARNAPISLKLVGFV